MSSLGVEEQADCFVSNSAVNGQALSVPFVPFCGFLVKRIKVKYIADFTFDLNPAPAAPTVVPCGGIFQLVIRELGNLPIAQFGLYSFQNVNNDANEIGGAQVNAEDEVVFDTPLQVTGRPFTVDVLRWNPISKAYFPEYASLDHPANSSFPKSIAVHLKFYKH